MAFSRQDIFSIKREIELLTPYKCCAIYGALPSETRSAQARLFNEKNTGYDVLVASDAIGMGLNLNIKRIVLHSAVKAGRGSPEYLDPSSVKQIIGRAGRLSSEYAHGEVTAWQNADLAYIKAVMNWDVPKIKAVGLMPSVEQVEFFSQQIKSLQLKNKQNTNEYDVLEVLDVVDDDDENGDSESEKTKLTNELDEKKESNISNVNTAVRLSALMAKYVDVAQLDGRYFICEHSDFVTVANWLHTIPLSLEDMFVFSNAPVDQKNYKAMNMLYSFASSYTLKRPVAMNIRLPRQCPQDLFEFETLCSMQNILELYLWLSFRFPKYFVEQELCMTQRAFALKLIENALSTSSFDQDYSHSFKFMKIRDKLSKKCPDNLPPKDLGPIRADMKKILDSFDKDKLYCYPAKNHFSY